LFSFYEVFKECRKSVLSSQFQSAIQECLSRPPLDSFKKVEDLLAFLNQRFNQTCLGEVRRQNAVLKRLLQIHQSQSAQINLDPLFLVLFQPPLQLFFRRYLWIEPEGNDLGQVIFASFLDVLRRYPLRRKPEKIALHITLDTKNKVWKWVESLKQRLNTELMGDKKYLELKQVIIQSPEDALHTLIDLSKGFGYDEATDRLCLRIQHLHKKGAISEMEKEILIGRFIYQKTLVDLVPVDEYERWKKQMQRLTKLIYPT
jgi:hypothetical protein